MSLASAATEISLGGRGRRSQAPIACAKTWNEPSVGVRRRGRQTRMRELQLRGAIETSHERVDPWAVRLLQIVGGCAVDPLFGQGRLHGVKPLVQVHDQLVQAVRPATLGQG
jgi:hypothetical protein